jgi:hypothetical protein
MSKFSGKIGYKQFLLPKRLVVVMIVLIVVLGVLSMPLANGTHDDRVGNAILNSGGRIVNQTRLDDEIGPACVSVLFPALSGLPAIFLSC